MNQDDFRKLLAAGGGGKTHSSKKGGRFGGNRITHLDAEGIRKLSAKKSSKKNEKPLKQQEDDLASEYSAPAASQYRDRAAERRQGLNVDMENPEDFAHLRPVQTHAALPASVAAKLPKGLDLSLLSKLKQEKVRLEEAAAAERKKMSASPHTEVEEIDVDKEPTFQTRLGRMVYFYALQHHPFNSRSTPTKSEAFLPGRMYYTFRLSGGDASAIPLAVQRSKEDCPDSEDVVSGMVDDLVIADIGRVLEAKRSRKRVKQAATQDVEMAEADGEAKDATPTAGQDNMFAVAAPDQDDDEEDIFPDAGDYVPAYLREDEDDAASTTPTESRTGYFSNLSASITEAELSEQRKEQEKEAAWRATLEKAAAAQAKLEKELEAKKRAAKLLESRDAYGEEYLDGDVDDDDVEDEGGARGKKKRKDAEGSTDEISTDEKDRRKKQKQSNKLQNDLKKINQLIETKAE